MSNNNKYMDAIEEALLDTSPEETMKAVTSGFFATLALVKELQTLNETLKELKDEVKYIKGILPVP